jgi:hypothetical protein
MLGQSLNQDHSAYGSGADLHQNKARQMWNICSYLFAGFKLDQIFLERSNFGNIEVVGILWGWNGVSGLLAGTIVFKFFLV